MAADSDDGKPALRTKARRAFRSWLGRLRSIAEQGQARREIRSGVDPSELATLIVTSLEGALMLERLQKNPAPLNIACRHLEEFLETRVRAKQSKVRAEKT
jgi:hypothetical protein